MHEVVTHGSRFLAYSFHRPQIDFSRKHACDACDCFPCKVRVKSILRRLQLCTELSLQVSQSTHWRPCQQCPEDNRKKAALDAHLKFEGLDYLLCITGLVFVDRLEGCL